MLWKAEKKDHKLAWEQAGKDDTEAFQELKARG